MAKFTFDAGDWADINYKAFSEAGKKLEPSMKQALWEGAHIVDEAVKQEASKFGDLAQGVRVARHKDTADGVDTLVYFDGYDKDGVPWALKANAINSGRSTPKGGKTKAHPFFRTAIKKCQAKAAKKMSDTFNDLMTKELEI